MKRFLPTIFTIKNKIIGCSLSRAVILLILFFICNPFGISAQTAEINPNETCLEAISSNNVIEFKGSYTGDFDFSQPDDSDYWYIDVSGKPSGSIEFNVDSNDGFSYWQIQTVDNSGSETPVNVYPTAGVDDGYAFGESHSVSWTSSDNLQAIFILVRSILSLGNDYTITVTSGLPNVPGSGTPATTDNANRIIVNPSFETGSIVPHTGVAYPESQTGDNPQIDGWYSNHPEFQNATGPIEHWRSGFNSIPAQEGVYFAELNVTQPSRLFQVVYLVNGENIDWEYYHRKRVDSQTETVEFSIYSTDGLSKLFTIDSHTASGTNTWDQVSGSYTFTGTTGVYQIGFEAVQPVSGGTGNFLDNITIGMQAITEFKNDAITINESQAASFNPAILVNGSVKTASSITFNLTSTNAVEGRDYTFSNNTVSVPVNNYSLADSIPIGLSIIDNTLSQGDYTLELNITSTTGDLSNADSNGDGFKQTYTINVVDDDKLTGFPVEFNLWLKANTGVTTSGSNLTDWIDQTRKNTFTVSGSPTVSENTVNFNPVVNFTNVLDSSLPDNGLVGSTAITAVEAFGVFKYENSADRQGTILGGTTGEEAIFSSLINGLKNSDNAGNDQFFVNPNVSTTYTINNVDVAPTLANASINGLSTGVTQDQGGDFSAINFDAPVIGGGANRGRLNGSLAELIVYPTSLVAEERIKIESYLAIKYGINLEPSVVNYVNSSGTVLWNDTTYWNDVFGIGKDDISKLNQTQSNSINTGSGDGSGQSGKGNIVIKNASSLENGDFLMIGHNNDLVTEQNTSLPVSMKGKVRLGRAWKVKRTGDVGTIDLDLSVEGISVAGTQASEFKLLIDQDGDGDFTTGTLTEIVANAFSNDIVSFTGITIPDNTVFTLLTGTRVGPGVLGANLWLKGDEGITSSGNDVTDWIDLSGKNTFTKQGTVGYINNAINFNPTVSFSNSNAVTDTPSNRLDGNTEIQVVDAFAVYKNTNNNSTLLGSIGNTSSNKYGAAFFNSSGENSVWIGSGAENQYSHFSASGVTGFYNLVNLDVSPTSSPYVSGKLNGKDQVLSTGSAGDYTNISFVPRIGGTDNGSVPYGWAHGQGELAEVVTYSNSLSVEDKLKIESYLAVKYGISLDPSVVNYVDSKGNVLWNKTTHWNNVFGIGKDDASTLNQSASNSIDTGSGDGTGQSGAGNIVLENPSSLEDGDFLIIGHNDDPLVQLNSGEQLPINFSNFKRLDREWWVQETGDVGEVDLKLDINGLTVTGTTASDFRLIIDNDSDGDLTTGKLTIIEPDDITSGIITFTALDLPNNQAFSLITEVPTIGAVGNEALWLKADTGVRLNNGDLTNWADQSGLNSFTVLGQPVYENNALNFNPVVSFSNTTNFGIPENGLTGNKQIEVHEFFAVYKYESASSQGTLLGEDTSQNAIFSGVNNVISNSDNNTNSNSFTNSDIGDAYSINAINIDNNLAYINALNTIVSISGANFTSINFNIPVIGGGNSKLKLNGSVAEIVAFPSSLTNNERIEVESYLAIKYGITLDASITNYLTSEGIVIWNDTQYWNDVFGIGKDDDSGLNQSQSNSIATGSGNGAGQSGKGNIVINNPSSLEGGDFLIIGHDNGTLTEQTTDIPASESCFVRLNRVWKAKTTNDPGTVRLTFDLKDLVISGTVIDDFKMLIDTDGDNDFTTGATAIIPTDITSNILVFDGLTLSDGAIFTFLTGRETEQPTITCPSDVSVFNDTGSCSTVVNNLGATINDNCGISSLVWFLSGDTIGSSPSTGINDVSGQAFNIGVTTVNYIVEDLSGNTNTCSFTLTVSDDEDPTISCLANQSVSADTGECFYTAIGAEFDPTSVDDNCGIASLTNDFNGLSTLDGAQIPDGTVITWTVTDNAGNTNTCDFTVTVTDDENPTISCVGDQNKTADVGECFYTVVGVEFDPTATNDNCGIASVTNDFNSLSTLDGAQIPDGTLITWTVTDNAGNTNTCDFTVTVTDNENPTISCVGDQSKTANVGECFYTVVATEFDPTATDNCGIASITNDFNSMSTLDGAQIPDGTVITWTVTDNAGNTNTCGFTVTVTDDENPTISCVGDQNKTADAGECFYTVVGVEFDPTATNDNCGIASVTNDFNSLSTLDGAQIPDGTVITWTVTDNVGNTEDCSFTVTVTDNENPTISCISDQSKTANVGECFYTVVATEFDPAATDNCGIASITNDFNNLSTLDGSQIPDGTVITWTVTDNAGNTNTCSFTVTVKDNENPVAICKNITVALDASGTALVTANDINNGSYDDCEIASITIDKTNFICTDIGANNVVLTVEDKGGNTSSCTAIVTIIDDLAPVPNINPLPEVSGISSVTVIAPTATDNCIGTLTATTTDPLTYNTPGTFIIDWFYEDASGNTTTQSQTVIVENKSDVASIESISLGNQTYTNPGEEIYYLMDCSSGDDSVDVSIVTEDKGSVSPSENFTISTPKAGIYTQEVVITSEDQSNSKTYTLIIERRFEFSDIVIQKFDNILLVNNNSSTNGGYKFVSYEWFKNGQLVGTGQYYSAGENANDILDASAAYHVKMTTTGGEVYQTCDFNIDLNYSHKMTLYPNPSQKGKMFTVKVDLPDEDLKDMNIGIYSISGELIKEVKSSSRTTEIKVPDNFSSATYLVRVNTKKQTKTLKLIVY
ncbi:HYR domain-containing protein [Joostella sp.]|uniref:HYR domain-containing protein n=1 Tax=Joostella sp. TaxID=2231138 RepID=UPI003A8DE1DB